MSDVQVGFVVLGVFGSLALLAFVCVVAMGRDAKLSAEHEQTKMRMETSDSQGAKSPTRSKAE